MRIESVHFQVRIAGSSLPTAKNFVAEVKGCKLTTAVSELIRES